MYHNNYIIYRIKLTTYLINYERDIFNGHKFNYIRHHDILIDGLSLKKTILKEHFSAIILIYEGFLRYGLIYYGL